MDLVSRKLAFIKEFLELENEKTIARLEKVLKDAKNPVIEAYFKPITEEELKKHIKLSEKDFENKRFKETEELISKYQ